MSTIEELVDLGFCSKPHGIKGGFTLNLSNKEDSILEKGFALHIFPNDGSSSIPSEGEVHKISQITFGNKIILYLKGISDRNLVESMLPFIVKAPRSAFPKLDEGEFYIADLIGLKVISNETKEDLGVVEGYYDNTVQIILKLSGGVEIPFLDQFVPVVNIEEGLIEVMIPEVV